MVGFEIQLGIMKFFKLCNPVMNRDIIDSMIEGLSINYRKFESFRSFTKGMMRNLKFKKPKIQRDLKVHYEIDTIQPLYMQNLPCKIIKVKRNAICVILGDDPRLHELNQSVLSSVGNVLMHMKKSAIGEIRQFNDLVRWHKWDFPTGWL